LEGILISVLFYPPPLLGGRARGLKNIMSKWVFQFSKCPQFLFVFSHSIHQVSREKRMKKIGADVTKKEQDEVIRKCNVLPLLHSDYQVLQKQKSMLM
jgi:hypothetical protein